MITFDQILFKVDSNNRGRLKSLISEENRQLILHMFNYEVDYQAMLICNSLEIPPIAYLVKRYNIQAEKPERLAIGQMISVCFDIKCNYKPIKKKTFATYMNGFKTAQIYG